MRIIKLMMALLLFMTAISVTNHFIGNSEDKSTDSLIEVLRGNGLILLALIAAYFGLFAYKKFLEKK